MLRQLACFGLVAAVASGCGSTEFTAASTGQDAGADSSAGSGGTAGAAGSGGSGGMGGTGGIAGSGGTGGMGGTGGDAGAGGTGGIAGSGGTGGMGGTGGDAGAGGTGGTTGTGGTAGTGGIGGAGGAGGTSGTGGTGGAGGSPPGPECSQASECTLHSDCCNCVALAPGESPPPCNINTCFATACAVMGVDDTSSAQCNAGRCSIGFNCDPAGVTCMLPIPECDPGMVNSVRGICWGPCVPAQDCTYVPSCASCDPNTSTCVSYDSSPARAHCVDIPSACDNDVSCACMSANVCISPYDKCTEDNSTPKILHCECLGC